VSTSPEPRDDLSRLHEAVRELALRNAELERANAQIERSQEKLLQSDKLASIGQLAAGVAHEINNPIGYVQSNLGSLKVYTEALGTMLAAYAKAMQSPDPAAERDALDELHERLDLAFVLQDLPQLLAESREGIERVSKIVQDLKDFSRPGRDETWTLVDLHRCIETTLNIVSNEIKYKADVVRHYGQLPPVPCLPSEINQVLMNLLLNAAQAIRERGTITIETEADDDEARVRICDTGHGIPDDVVEHLFEPFFTTKPPGQGTGLGLPISHGIIARHHGRIDVANRAEGGACFTIALPLRRE
jgi:two-component system, NtrC family, sensor kinase